MDGVREVVIKVETRFAVGKHIGEQLVSILVKRFMYLTGMQRDHMLWSSCSFIVLGKATWMSRMLKK